MKLLAYLDWRGLFNSVMISILAILAFILMAPAQSLHAQQQSVEFVQYFRDLQNDFIRERVYLHTDRQWYVHGDRIWFSAFVTAGGLNLPSAISSVLYVELFDPEGSLIERVSSRIESGRATGSITFSNSVQREGIYKIKAYTAWAKNFGESYVHELEIPVLTNDTDDVENSAADGVPDLQFFPEGGQLIASLPQRIAFKAIGEDGLSRDVTGWLFNENRTDSLYFESEHNGMGIVDEWISHLDGSSFAIAKIDGETVRTDLPAPVPEGSALSIDQNLSDFLIDIKTTDPDSQNGSLLLFAHVRGEVYFASLVLMENGQGLTSVPNEQFPSGIVHFTLLNKNGLPASERLVFNNNELDFIDTELQLEKEIFGLRDEVALTLVVSDAENVLIPAKTSLSVFDDTYVNYNHRATNIRSRLYFETEIRGHIEDPGYYLSDSPSADHHLDLLLLTQGWRSYDMKMMAERSDITLFSLPEDGFSISGTIKSGFRGRPLENATVAFSLNTGEENLQIVTTDADGKFEISGLDMEGTAAFTLRANNENGSDRVQIELDRQFSHLDDESNPVPNKLDGFLFDDSMNNSSQTENEESIAELQQRAETARAGTERFVDAQLFGELDEITVTGQSEQIDEEEQERRFGERPSQRIDFDEQVHMASLPIAQSLNQMLGVSVVGNQVEISTGFSNIGGSSLPPPLILVDNIETDVSYLLNLSPSEVKTINVFRRSSELGSFGISGTGGVISVRTRRGDSGFVENERGTLTGRLSGYLQPTQFYSPRYGVSVPRDLEEPDERITLHWEGDLTIPDTGGTLRFWTNDIPSRYRVVVQGITQNGIPFSATRTFETAE